MRATEFRGHAHLSTQQGVLCSSRGIPRGADFRDIGNWLTDEGSSRFAVAGKGFFLLAVHVWQIGVGLLY